MAASTKSALLVAAAQIRNEHVDKANTAIRVGDELIALIKSLRFNVFDVTSYGIDATGSTGAQAAAAFALADTDAAASGGTVYVPPGTYGDGTDWTITLPSGVTLEMDRNATLVNVWIHCAGSTGNELAFTAPAAKGATSISIPATGLTDAWLRIASVINCQSPDAGVDQLGTQASDASFFAEFVRVKSGGVSSATLYGPIVFPYSNTPGGDSGSFTTSVARVVTFHEGARIRGGRLLGKNSTKSELILAEWCRDLVIEGVTLDANDTSANLIRRAYCYECTVRDVRGFAKKTGTGAQHNGVLTSSSQDCDVVGGCVNNGYQCYDFTYQVGDATYRGGPSVNCAIRGAHAKDPSLDGIVDHYGCYQTLISDCVVTGAPNYAVRVRGRRDLVSNVRISGLGVSATGVLISDAAFIDSRVTDCMIDGGSSGIIGTHAETGLEALEALRGCGACQISRNTIRNTSGVSIFVDDGYTAATICGPRITLNEITAPGSDGIRIDPYNNGTVVDGNRISGVPASRGGINWGANIKRLHIDENHIYGVNASGFALKGPSTSSFMTDATTFPSGESEAQLYIGKTHTDAAVPFSGIYRDTGGVAYARAQVAGWQPNVGGLSPAAPTLSTAAMMAWYLSGTEMLGKSVDAAGAVSRTYILCFTGSADPTAGGGVPATQPALYIRTTTGVLYTKTGAGDTAWTVVGTQT